MFGRKNSLHSDMSIFFAKKHIDSVFSSKKTVLQHLSHFWHALVDPSDIFHTIHTRLIIRNLVIFACAKIWDIISTFYIHLTKSHFILYAALFKFTRSMQMENSTKCIDYFLVWLSSKIKVIAYCNRIVPFRHISDVSYNGIYCRRYIISLWQNPYLLMYL